jgi:hypothetical protein
MVTEKRERRAVSRYVTSVGCEMQDLCPSMLQGGQEWR